MWTDLDTYFGVSSQLLQIPGSGTVEIGLLLFSAELDAQPVDLYLKEFIPKE